MAIGGAIHIGGGCTSRGVAPREEYNRYPFGFVLVLHDLDHAWLLNSNQLHNIMTVITTWLWLFWSRAIALTPRERGLVNCGFAPNRSRRPDVWLFGQITASARFSGEPKTSSIDCGWIGCNIVPLSLIITVRVFVTNYRGISKCTNPASNNSVQDGVFLRVAFLWNHVWNKNFQIPGFYAKC